MKCVFAEFKCPVPTAYDTDILEARVLAQFCQACPAINAVPEEIFFRGLEKAMKKYKEAS